MNTSTWVKLGLPICLVFVSCIVFSAGMNSPPRFVVNGDKRIVAMANEKVATDSIMECARKCYSSWNCAAANYFADNKACYFFDQPYRKSEDAFGWIYLQKPTERTFRHITDRTETWDGAKSYCESIGGGLANVNTPSDYEMIKTILDPSQNHRVWLGGSDSVSEGEWIWSNGRRFHDQYFDFWRQGEPNNTNQDQHCLEIYNLEWNDQFCFSLQTFVCEFQVA